MTPEELLIELVNEGGSIVCSGECSAAEIVAARASNRFAVTDAGFGFVLRPKHTKRKINRSSESGQFVSKPFVVENPETTTTELC
jgi:hypothetical protein